MILSEQAEEILEAIWIHQEDHKTNRAKMKDLREAPSEDVLKELIEASIVECVGESEIRLTEEGLICARDAVRRHRLAERLLTDVLAVKKDMIHETACQFEHHLHRGIDANVCTLLGHPKACPHGRPIPPGKCCETGTKIVSQAVSAMTSMKPGDSGRVAYLYTQDPKRAQMLFSMGVLPGAAVKLLTSFPSYLFQLGEGQFAVDKEVAGGIYVRVGEH